MVKAKWLVPLVCALLGGCFMSKQALVTTTNADYPLAKGSRFTEMVDCSGGAATLACAGKSGYKAVARGVVTIKNGHYVVQYDANSSPAFSMPAMKNSSNPTFLMKSVGGGYYVAEIDTVDMGGGNADMANKMLGGGRYIYFLVHIKGHALYRYGSTCESNGDRHYVKAGKLASIANGMGMPICLANNLGNLGAILRERVTNGENPAEKIEFQ